MKKMSFTCNVHFIFWIIYFIREIRMEVPEYCLQPLNRDDCGLSPVTVVTYWKPGSRCEIDLWRGCPTTNKFPDEYNCSSTCIFKNRESNECEATLDENTCTDIEKVVYTFRNGLCVPGVWRGCQSINKFINRTACMIACGGQWQENLEDINMEGLKQVNSILDSILEDPKNDSSDDSSESSPSSDSITELSATESGSAESEATESNNDESEQNKTASVSQASESDDSQQSIDQVYIETA